MTFYFTLFTFYLRLATSLTAIAKRCIGLLNNHASLESKTSLLGMDASSIMNAPFTNLPPNIPPRIFSIPLWVF